MVCDNTFVLKALLFISNIMEIVKIAVPIGLIIFASIDLGKYMLKGEDDSGKIKSMIVHRFAAAVIVFFVPTVVSVAFGLVGTFSPLLDSCRTNANADTIKLLDQLAAKSEPIGNDDPDDPTNNNPEDLTVATWNIGHGLKHDGITPSLLGNEIKQYNMDIMGMQETGTSYSDNSSTKIKKIFKYTDMKYLFYTASPAGNSVLSKIKIDTQSAQKLKRCHETRYLQKVIITVAGKNISFYNTHASYNDDCKLDQYEDIYNKIKNDPNPTILLGDFNAGSNCDSLRDAFGGNYSLEVNDSLSGGHKCTDSIIISKNRGITLKSQKTIKTDEDLSDHNMVIATFTIQ